MMVSCAMSNRVVFRGLVAVCLIAMVMIIYTKLPKKEKIMAVVQNNPVYVRLGLHNYENDSLSAAEEKMKSNAAFTHIKPVYDRLIPHNHENDRLSAAEERMKSNAAFTQNLCEALKDRVLYKTSPLADLNHTSVFSHNNSFSDLDKGHISKTLIRHDHRWMLTLIPKCGWSTWNNLLFEHAEAIPKLRNNTCYAWYIDYNPAGYQTYNLTFFITMDPESIPERVIFVRDPYERLVSAYKDKVLNHDGRYVRSTHRPCGWYNKRSSGTLSFKQFCKCIILRAKSFQAEMGVDALWKQDNAGIHPLDQHWTPQTSLALPCVMNYTLISKHETFELDTRAITRLMGMTVSERFMHINQSPNPSEDRQSTSLRQWYSELDGEMISELQQLYKLDFELFGYPNVPM